MESRRKAGRTLVRVDGPHNTQQVMVCAALRPRAETRSGFRLNRAKAFAAALIAHHPALSVAGVKARLADALCETSWTIDLRGRAWPEPIRSPIPEQPDA